jgi:EAL domain-containing protein (putative c-di-GMP-specific phosphodiesterase class I)
MSSAAEGDHVAERILAALHYPLQVSNHEVFVMASIGIAFADLNTRTPEDLMRNADAALYQAKATGKGRYIVFDDSLAGQAVERVTLEAELRSALAESQLLIHYQPEIDLNTGEIAGFEALVHWQHPRRGIIYPEEFLETVRESGCILPISQWMLTEACRTAATWQIPQDGGLLPSVHVNLTDCEFRQPQFVELTRSVLADTGLAPARLKLEVIESVIARGDSSILLQLKQLSELGVRIVIDNFGSGYSSLSILAQMTAETIKIDRMFVSGQNSLTSNLAIIRAITSLAHAFGMDVVAQGIETQEQKIRVTSAGCNRGQGNYIYPPMDADDVHALLSLTGIVGS